MKSLLTRKLRSNLEKSQLRFLPLPPVVFGNFPAYRKTNKMAQNDKEN